jgi:hypothetical protein
MDDWREVYSLSPLLTNQLSQKATYSPKLSVPQETTALAFDTKQDILWAGNKQVIIFDVVLIPGSRDRLRWAEFNFLYQFLCACR